MYKLKPPIAEIKFVGSEPDYTDMAVTEQSYQGILGNGLNWYNYLCDAKDNRAFLEDWIKTYKLPEDLKTLRGIPDKWLPSTYAHCARMQVRGFPLKEDDQDRIWIRVTEAYEKSSKDGKYWRNALPCAVDKVTASAIGAYAETLSLSRMRIIISDPNTPVDLKSLFVRIEPDEARHVKLLRGVAGKYGMKSVVDCHNAGLEELGLRMQK